MTNIDNQESRDNLLKILSAAPDRQLDKSMCDYLKSLVGRSDEDVKKGVRYVLDASCNGGLASDFTMMVLDTMWKTLGGKLEDVPEDERGKKPIFD